MKKLLKTSIMPLVTIFALTSCGETPSITPEVAKQRANDILSKQESSDFNIPNKVSIQNSISINANSTTSTQLSNISYVTEIDLENFYFHNSFNSTVVNSKISSDFWNYFEESENSFYTVYQLGDNQYYSKLSLNSDEIEALKTNYSKFINDSISAFKNKYSNISLIDFDYSSTPKELSFNSTGLEEIINFANKSSSDSIQIEDDQDSEINFSGSYKIDKLDFRSNGEGSLEAWLNGSINLAVGAITTTSNLDTSIIYKDYLFSASSINYSSSIVNGDQKSTVSLTSTSTANYSVTINKPTLK